MCLRLAALAVLVVVLRVHAQPAADPEFTLDSAIARVAEVHPELRLFDTAAAVLDARAEEAAFAPPLRVGAEIENVAGTGGVSGVGGAELTLSLASVLERGGKRDARRALAAHRLDALGVERAAARLDLAAEVARRYLDALAAQQRLRIAEADLAQRSQTAQAARRRVEAGGAPRSVQLGAEAMRERARIQRDRAASDIEASWRALALLWGESDAAPPVLAGDPLDLPEVADLAALSALLQRSPELERFASEARLRETRVQLARSQTSADLDWAVGLRRLQDGSDWALVGSVSLPLGASRRAAPGIRGAEAERAGLALEREVEALALAATLAQAHGVYRAAQEEVRDSGRSLLPLLEEAEAAAGDAYRAGALGYLEWAQLQGETTSARLHRLEAAIQAQRALIELQRLTAEPLTAAGRTDTDSLP